MSILISFQAASEALDKAVAAKGEDYIYERGNNFRACRYFDKNGKPSCIVGWVLADLGMPALAFDDDMNTGSVNSLRNMGLIEFEDIDEDDSSRTLTLLAEAQDHQDSEQDWGSSVRWAKEYVDEMDPVS